MKIAVLRDTLLKRNVKCVIHYIKVEDNDEEKKRRVKLWQHNLFHPEHQYFDY